MEGDVKVCWILYELICGGSTWKLGFLNPSFLIMRNAIATVARDCCGILRCVLEVRVIQTVLLHGSGDVQLGELIYSYDCVGVITNWIMFWFV